VSRSETTHSPDLLRASNRHLPNNPRLRSLACALRCEETRCVDDNFGPAASASSNEIRAMRINGGEVG